MAAAEKKVFDVGKPGSAKPETGSKPMVIGHKSLLTDPAIKEDSKQEENIKEEDTKKTEKSRVELKPISEPEKEEPRAETNEQSEVKATEEKTAQEVEATEPEEEQNQDQVKQDKKKEEADLDLERTERLEAIIKSKEYFVPIKESNKTAVRTFSITLFIVILVGVVAAVLLMDAEVIDLGIDLPFDLL
jgi:cobalamin biosynthesis Mg chelatase CobN